MYKLEQNSTPLYIQLYEQIKDNIKKNNLAGTKLLSIRKMCQEYKLSKTTVETAYNQLYAEGYIESRPQSGYFVSHDIYQGFPTKTVHENNKKTAEKTYRYNFFPAQYNEDVFPKKLWSKLHSKAISQTHFGIYPNHKGDLGLRQQVAKYLESSRAVICEEDQIIICSGFSDSMFIIANLLKNFTNTISIEYPGYKVTKKVFQQNGYSINPVNITQHGIDIQQLKETTNQLLYVTPSHQYPTGVTIPIANRIKLIEWAVKTNSYIIEDDYDSELSYNNRPIPSLQGISNNERVIYSGTFSKALSPALRISYLVLPKKLLNLYNKIFTFAFSGVSIDTQKTLELFIKEEHWEKHIRKIRTLNKKKHDLMKKAIIKYLKDTVEILREGSGLSILMKPTIAIDLKQLNTLMDKNLIKIYPAKLDSTLQDDTLSMGFGTIKEEEIDQSIQAFATIWHSCK